jgi:rhodanese-related sulfurtransferase
VLLPFSDLTGQRDRWASFLAGVAGRELLIYCASGRRAGCVVRVLANEGFLVANTGGLAAWAQAGWPIVPTS